MRLINPKKAKALRSANHRPNEENENANKSERSSEGLLNPSLPKRCLATFSHGCSVQLTLDNATVGTAKLMAPTEGSASDIFTRFLHGSPLAEFEKTGEDLVVIRDVRTHPQAAEVVYPFRYGGIEDPPELLSGLSSGFHAWDRHCMLPNSTVEAHSSKLQVRSTAHTSSVRAHGICKDGNEDFRSSELHKSVGARPSTAFRKAAHNSTSPAPPPRSDDAPDSEAEIYDRPDSLGTRKMGIEDGPGMMRGDSNPQAVEGREVGAVHRVLPTSEESSDIVSLEGTRNRTSSDRGQVRLRHEQPGGRETGTEVRHTERNGDVMECIGQRNNAGQVVELALRGTGDETSSGTTSLSPVRRRAYTYINRRRREDSEEPELHKKRRRTSTTFTNENITYMKCCLKLDCFGQSDKSYLRAQVVRVLGMSQDARRNVLEGMLDRELQVYLFNGKRVCATFLENAFGFSRYLQSRVKQTPGSIRRYERRAIENEYPKMKQRDAIICYLERLADSTADKMPDCEEFHLPFFQKDDVYKEFCQKYAMLHERKDMTCGRKREPPTSSYFYSVWARHCSHVKVRSTHRFTKCGDCERLRAALEAKRTDVKAATALKLEKRQHNEMVSRERREYAKKSQNAILYPESYCSIIVDGADQSAFGLPNFRVSVKEARGHAIGVKLIGVLEHGPNKKVSLFLMTEQYETGANHIIEAMHRNLTQKCLTGRLPPTLYIQADNCHRENKNQFFFAYCESLVAWGVFREVYVSFLPIGHTHSDIDQVFSRTSTRLRHKDAVTMEELMSELSKSYTPEPHVVHMRGIANFSGLCREQKCSSPVTGFTEYRYFRFVTVQNPSELADRHHSTSCLVRMCCEDDWMPLRGENEAGFVLQVPDLAMTPPTPVKSPTNLSEINTRLRSEENRIKRTRMKSLEDLRDEVYKSGEEPFHWNLSTCFELKGRYARNRGRDGSGSEEEEAEDIPEEDLEYGLNELVATKSDGEEESVPFWIGRIVEIERNDSGVVVKLLLYWFEMYKGSTVYNGKYRPCNPGSGRSRKPGTTAVSVNTVIHRFTSLTRSKMLTTADRKSIWQALH